MIVLSIVLVDVLAIVLGSDDCFGFWNFSVQIIEKADLKTVN